MSANDDRKANEGVRKASTLNALIQLVPERLFSNTSEFFAEDILVRSLNCLLFLTID